MDELGGAEDGGKRERVEKRKRRKKKNILWQKDRWGKKEILPYPIQSEIWFPGLTGATLSYLVRTSQPMLALRNGMFDAEMEATGTGEAFVVLPPIVSYAVEGTEKTVLPSSAAGIRKLRSSENSDPDIDTNCSEKPVPTGHNPPWVGKESVMVDESIGDEWLFLVILFLLLRSLPAPGLDD